MILIICQKKHESLLRVSALNTAECVYIFSALEQTLIQRLKFECLLFMYMVLIHLVAACAKVAAPQHDELKKNP